MLLLVLTLRQLPKLEARAIHSTTLQELGSTKAAQLSPHAGEHRILLAQFEVEMALLPSTTETELASQLREMQLPLVVHI